MNENNYCVIMAGGVGSRFWPISRRSKPKQFLDVLGTGKSFIRTTFERFANIIPLDNIFVATNLAYRDMVLAEIPELAPERVLCEPVGRNTAPCVAYAAMRIRSINPAARMVVTPSDHLILNEIHFCEVIQQCLDFLDEQDALITIGLQPTRPETGYGYIQVNKHQASGKFNKAKTFTEKPNLELAKIFVDSGEYFWNSGIFVWGVQTILDAFEKLQPEIYGPLNSIADHYGKPTEQAQIDIVYPECRGISVDYGIMERYDNVWVRCSDLGWSDVGTWGSMYEYSTKDDKGNTFSTNTFAFDTEGCVIRTTDDKVVVVEGLKEYIVVDTPDVLMVCPRSAEQNIKRYIETVNFTKGNKFI